MATAPQKNMADMNGASSHVVPTPKAWQSAEGRDIWNIALKRVEKRLTERDREKINSIGGYEDFSQSLESKSRAYGKSTRLARILEKLGPALKHLQSFSGAVQVLAQSQGHLSLIWGSLMLIMDISLRYLNTLERIVDMFVDITKGLPRFDLYLQLFATEDRLREAVAELYSDYVQFSVQTIEFLKRRPILSLLQMFWSPLQKCFELTMGQIEKDSEKVEKEAAAANYVMQKQRENAAKERHEEILSVFPDIEIKLKTQITVRSVPVQRNRRFYGRRDVLEYIFTHLIPRRVSSVQDTMQSFALHGMGGIGKTQTATEFLYRYGDHYSVILWMRADSAAVLMQEFADAATRVGVVQQDEAPDLNTCIARFRAWLSETNQDWLLVLDNVEQWEDIKDLWPSSNRGSILLTTRNEELRLSTTEKWRLEPYSPTDGALFLRDLLDDEDEHVKADAIAVATEMDGYPLALSHAAGYIVTHRITCKEFSILLRDLRQVREVNQSSISLSMIPNYSYNVANVWTISLRKLPPMSREVLNITCFLAPDTIQMELLQGLAVRGQVDRANRTQQSPSASAKIHQVGTVLRSLVQHALLSQRHTTFVVHRLLQRDLLLRLQDEPDLLNDTFLQASNVVRNAFPKQYIAEPIAPFAKECQAMLSHVLRLEAVFKDLGSLPKTEVFASLLGDAAYYQWERGLLKDALDLCFTARDILEEVADESSVHKADVLNVIGAIYIESGAAHIEEGTRIMERVLRIRANRLESRVETDPEFVEDLLCVSNAESNLTCCWIGLEQWDKAREVVEESIRKFERYCSEETHAYGFAERYANLGWVHIGNGNLEEGISYAKRATELQRHRFGEDDIRACVFESYWANFLIKAGKLDDAYELHKHALYIRKKGLGPKSNDVAKSLYFVAYCKYLQGDYAEAVQYLQDAIEIYGRMYWTDNRVARALFLLSMILEKQNHTTEASALRQRAGELRESLVGSRPSEDDTLEMYDRLVFYH